MVSGAQKALRAVFNTVEDKEGGENCLPFSGHSVHRSAYLVDNLWILLKLPFLLKLLQKLHTCGMIVRCIKPLAYFGLNACSALIKNSL